MYRKWDANIGVVIVFSMAIIIAGGMIGLMAYFYKKSLSNKSYVSILWNKLTSIKDIQALWLCKTSSYAKISYDLFNDTYKLICEKELWENISKFPEIIVVKDCQSTSNICEYKFRK